jgi:hypothetical protein
MLRLLALCACLLPGLALAKPIAFQDGATLMAEYGAGTMREAQLYYAPRYWWSAGVGYLRLDQEDGAFTRDISYARGNLLLKRWNLPDAQANIFASGGLGAARGSDFSGTRTATNAALQADYETRRIYGSLKSDWQYSSAYSHRIDTLQLGFAPYAHDWNVLATWFVFQARNYTGGLYGRVEQAVLLRLFKGGVWVEAGVTQDGKLQSMFMFNF